MAGPISDTTAEFGRRVRTRRKEVGLTQEKVAEQSGMHWTYVGQIERGERNLSLHNIVRLAAVLECTVGSLADDLPVPH